MSSMNDVARLKDIDNLADQTAQAINHLAQNGGSSSAVSGSNVLDTVPATVDGGLWRDFDGDPVIKMKCGDYAFSFAPADIASIDTQSDSLAPTSLPVSISGNSVTVNGVQFQLVNFQSGISVQDGCLFYGGKNCGFISVDGTTYSFVVTDPAILDTSIADGKYFAVNSSANISFFILDSSSLFVGKPNVRKKTTLRMPNAGEGDDTYGTLAYVASPAGLPPYVVRIAPNSFLFHPCSLREFFLYGDFRDLPISQAVNYLDCFFDENTDTTTLVIKSKYLLTSDFEDSEVEDGLYTKYIIFKPKATGTKKVFIAFGDDFDGTISPRTDASFVSGTTQSDGSTQYSFTAEGQSIGYFVQRWADDEVELDYAASARADNAGFTITGLAEDLTISKATDYTTDNLVYTISKGNVSVGTITLGSYKPTINISSLDAIYYDTFSKKYSDVTLNDNKDTDYDSEYKYQLTFADELTTAYNIAPQFTRSGTEGNYTYSFNSGYTTDYFNKTKDYSKDGGTITFSYSPSAISSSFPDDVSISGLADVGDVLFIERNPSSSGNHWDDYLIKNAGGSLVALYDGNASFTPYPIAIPVSPSNFHSVIAHGGDFSSRDADVTYHLQSTEIYNPDYQLSILNGTLSLVSDDSASGWVRYFGGYLQDTASFSQFLSHVNPVSFSISGFDSSLDNFRVLNTNLDHSYVQATSPSLTSLFDIYGRLVVINNMALPDNPDENSVFQLSNNSDGFFLGIGSNITKRLFSNEHINKTNIPGTYVYSADSSTVGWYVADNGNKLLYNPHDLSGSFITISGLRPDLGELSFNPFGAILSDNCGVVGKMEGKVITIYQHALISAGTTFSAT